MCCVFARTQHGVLHNQLNYTMSINIYVRVCVCVYVCVYMCVCVCVCVCVYNVLFLMKVDMTRKMFFCEFKMQDVNRD